MKKNLLALFALGAIYSAYAQDTNIKDAVIVKINPNTLFYNGGTVNVTTDAASATTEKIINKGIFKLKEVLPIPILMVKTLLINTQMIILLVN